MANVPYVSSPICLPLMLHREPVTAGLNQSLGNAHLHLFPLVIFLPSRSFTTGKEGDIVPPALGLAGTEWHRRCRTQDPETKSLGPRAVSCNV